MRDLRGPVVSLGCATEGPPLARATSPREFAERDYVVASDLHTTTEAEIK